MGTPITFALLATGLIGSERLRRRSTLLLSGPVAEACERLRSSMRIARRVSVAACEGLAQPVLVGIVRPMILLPAAAISGWTTAELEMVLVHELAHVRRWDNLVNLMQRIVESLLFFHPAVWLVSRQVRRDREECCDAAVVARTAAPQVYAELLMSIAAKIPRGQAPRLAIASAMADHPLAGRIRRILKLEDEPMWISRRMLGTVVSVLLATVAALSLFTARAAEQENASGDKPAEPSVAEAPDETAADAGESLAQETSAGRGFEAFHLKHARASMVTLNLEEYFAKELAADTADKLQFIWDADGNSIVVKNATDEQAATIRDLIELYDQPKESTSSEQRLDRLREKIKQMAPLFEPREDNPKQTAVYKYDKARREFVDHWHYIIGGLSERPEGKKFSFGWNRKSDYVEITAPAAAHKQLFEPAFAGVDPLAGESDEYRLRPGDRVKIEVAGAFPEHPIHHTHTVEPMGTVPLGAAYGRVKIAEKTVLEAEAAVKRHLLTILKDIEVQLTLESDSEERAPSRGKAAVNAPFNAAPQATYLYDGKTFDEWRNLWKHELKTERRTEAVEALAAFGRTGHSREAAEAILDVAGEYDFSHIDDNRPDGKLKTAVVDALTRGNRPPVAPSVWLPILVERARQVEDADQNQWQSLLASLIWRIEQPDQQVRRLLLELAEDKRLDPGKQALLVLIPGSLNDPDVLEVVRRSLADDDPNLAVLERLGLRHLDKVPEQLPLLFHRDEDVQAAARRALREGDPGSSPPVIDSLLAILDDPQRAEDHVAAIRALTACRQLRLHEAINEQRKVLARLNKVLVEGDRELLAPAIAAIASITGVADGQGLLDQAGSLENIVEQVMVGRELSAERKQQLDAAIQEASQELTLVLAPH